LEKDIRGYVIEASGPYCHDRLGAVEQNETRRPANEQAR
jgi:hypothetical protein